jgi:tetratricopeptide (TPR) repeat protein
MARRARSLLVVCAGGERGSPGQQDRQRAATALEQLFPGSALAWFHIGLARAATDPQGSRAANRRAIELDVRLAQPYVVEHLFLMQDGDHDGARTTFERGIALTADKSPERQQLLIVRARTCLQYRRFAEALDAAERALRIHDRSVTVLLLKVQAERGLDLPAAAATLQRVLEIAPDNAEARQLLGK